MHSAAHAKRQKAEAGEKPKAAQPELSKPLRNYVDLHRHAAVRADLLQNPDIALRLMLAHVIAGSSLWSVEPEQQRASKEATADSIAASPAQMDFEAERREVADLLGLGESDDEAGNDAKTYIVPRGQDFGAGRSLSELFATLLGLSDEHVRRVSAFVMAETLEVGSATIDDLGALFGTDSRQSWQADDAFFDLLRGKPAINAMVHELAGENAAASNLTATAKVQKAILRDCLSGARKAETENWQPRYMQFPMQYYCEAS
ncbi:hypothetical protein [Roseobacter litoralis]|uniref:hypothetical protein n=1 Tax=Roseobacter litoralis TaxID=42443 RepID=UPI0024906E8B|nr:hypothetical protein [Roseobacter litoralis]